MGRTTKTKDKVKLHKTIESRTDFFYYTFRNILLFGVPLLIVSGLVLSHTFSHVLADNSNASSDSLNISISSACTLSSSTDSAHTVSVNAGSYTADIGNTKINAYCNDNNGYSIYAIGSSNNVDGNTDLVSSINDNYNIHTGIYDSSSTSSYAPSSWSMKLTPGLGTGINPDTGESITVTPPTIRNNYDSYSLVPENYTLVASRPSRTDMTLDTTASGSYFTTTYDIYASSYQSPGAYTGKVKYLMVHPSSNISTVPDINTAFAVAGKMKVYEEGGNSYYAMQDMDSQICSFVAGTGASTATQLVDTRDNNLYWVAKLDDGKCWMTQNLDLDIGGTNTQPLNSNNTDISTDSSTYASSGIYSDYTISNGIYTWNPVSTAITSNGTISYPGGKNGPIISGWAPSSILPYSVEGGDVYYYTSDSTANDTRYLSLSSCATSGRTAEECKHYQVGNYYNWTATIASNNSTNISAIYAQATNSICPKGWRLPIVTNYNQSIYEFGNLFYDSNITETRVGSPASYKTNGFNNIRKSPLWFSRSGTVAGVYDSIGYFVVNSGALGYYWSNVAIDSINAYDSRFSSNNVSVGTYERHNGRSVRCIAR